ncbi:MAG: hypothetical protein IH877_01745, partial [Gemmatimonadetes bacterium]|nr:hypothetical protein [Gemmatimonadota bacterium]
MTEHQELEPKRNDFEEELTQDDLHDSLFRDVVSREIAHREGREEGQTVIVEPRPGGESTVVGPRDKLDQFHEFRQQDKAAYREVEVERFPQNPENQEKVKQLVLRRLSKARERLGFSKVPI